MFYERRRDMSQTKKMLGAVGVIALSAISAQAAVIATFGETTAPSSNIITSYVPPGAVDSVGWVNDGPTPNYSGHRKVSESFVVPSGPNYTLDKITMKLLQPIGADFTSPSTFTIDFYQVANVGDNPVSGTFVQTQSGTMQPTVAQTTAGSFFTFDLDNTITLQAGQAYAYVLDFPTTATYQFIKPVIGQSGGAADGSTVWRDIDFLNPSDGTVPWHAIGDTYQYYIQGTAVPEPAMGGLLLLGLSALARRVRR